MTEADEKLSRLFQAQAPERDALFADQVETRLRRAMQVRTVARAAAVLTFAVVAGLLWLGLRLAWRTAAPLIAESFGSVRLFEAEFLGAPAPALLLLALVGGLLLLRRNLGRTA